MPFYDIDCEACGPSVVLASIKDTSFTCECGKPARKLVSRPHGFKMPTEAPARYVAWLNSDATQARFRLPSDHPRYIEGGLSKSNDLFHQ